MVNFTTLLTRIGAAAVVLAMVPLAPLAAQAQDIPSYAQPTYASTDETIHGRIRSVDGAFNISVDDDRGFVDSVELHQGTIINPTGLTLSPGMSVTIMGTNAGSAFSANEIDTPYTYSGPLPEPVYYGPGYWAPGFAYGYGPSFSLAIVFGGGYGGWSFAHRPFYGRPWNGHGYFGAAVGYAPAVHEVGRPSARYPTLEHPAAAHVPAAYAGRTYAREAPAPRAQERELTSSRGAARAGSSAHAQGAARGGGHSH